MGKYFTTDTIDNASNYASFCIPKALMKNPKYQHINPLSKLLYGILLDKLSLSVENNWINELGRAYVLCPISEIQACLNCGKDKATRLMNELVKVGLIEKERQKVGEPDAIYIKSWNN